MYNTFPISLSPLLSCLCMVQSGGRRRKKKGGRTGGGENGTGQGCLNLLQLLIPVVRGEKKGKRERRGQMYWPTQSSTSIYLLPSTFTPAVEGEKQGKEKGGHGGAAVGWGSVPLNLPLCPAERERGGGGGGGGGGGVRKEALFSPLIFFPRFAERRKKGGRRKEREGKGGKEEG